MNLNVHQVGKSNLGLVNLDKFDPINGLIPLSVIPSRGTHCIRKHTKEENQGIAYSRGGQTFSVAGHFH
jgi:translation initiation factor 2 alpha subunit (eIF-2alpha)